MKHARGAAFIACRALARVRTGRGCRRREEGDLVRAPPRSNAPRQNDSALSLAVGGLGHGRHGYPSPLPTVEVGEGRATVSEAERLG